MTLEVWDYKSVTIGAVLIKSAARKSRALEDQGGLRGFLGSGFLALLDDGLKRMRDFQEQHKPTQNKTANNETNVVGIERDWTCALWPMIPPPQRLRSVAAWSLY